MRTDEIAAIQAAYREIDVVTAKWRALSATCDHLTPDGAANLDSLGACRACYLKCGALGIDPVMRAAQQVLCK